MDVGQGVEGGLAVGGRFRHRVGEQGIVGGQRTIRGQGIGGRGIVEEGVRESRLGGLNGGVYQKWTGGVRGIQRVQEGGTRVVSSMDQKSATIVQQHYNSLPISQVIGGAISLDGKPLGWPLDRPLGPSVWSVTNMVCQDVLIFHQDVPVTHTV